MKLKVRKSSKNFIVVLILIITAAVLVGCVSGAASEPVQEESAIYHTAVSGADAKEMFESDDQVILLDVRNQDEFDEYHIPGSILIPVDELESRLAELPDKNTDIIVFCRAGRRSEIAANILVMNGYKNVYDMGSINNWN